MTDQAGCEAISLPKAVRECFLALKAIDWSSDPAPWREVSRSDFAALVEGDPEGFTLRKKLESRAILLTQRALLRGDLKAFGHPNLKREIPGWAWQGLEGAEDVWFHGLMQVDPQLPADWQEWNGRPVFLERPAVMHWLDNVSLLEGADLPAMPEPYDLQTKPDLERLRLPPGNSFVTLSEALSWIAFSFSMDCDLLHRKALAPSTLSDDPERALVEAIASLASKASARGIELRGRYYEHHSVKDSEVLTSVIDPVRLDDFAQFDILHDGLRFGTGLTWQKGNNSLDRIMQDRGDCYRAVRVNRADLLRLWPAEDDLTRALFSPIPATIPDIGPVIRLDEALAILATGRPSNDLEVWTDKQGNLKFRSRDGDLEAHREKYLLASRLLHSALRDGALNSYVSPPDLAALAISRLHWSSINPLALDHIYTPEGGTGCPVLLSRSEFEPWRAKVSSEAKRQKGAPAHRKLDHDAIKRRAKELRAQQPDLKIGPAAASIVAELGKNPRTGKSWDYRHIERMIGGIWRGGQS